LRLTLSRFDKATNEKRGFVQSDTPESHKALAKRAAALSTAVLAGTPVKQNRQQEKGEHCGTEQTTNDHGGKSTRKNLLNES